MRAEWQAPPIGIILQLEKHCNKNTNGCDGEFPFTIAAVFLRIKKSSSSNAREETGAAIWEVF